MKFKNLLIPIAISVVLPLVIRSEYWFYILTLASVFSILALGLNIVMGLCGQISLGHAAFWGIGAYTSGILLVKLQVPFIVALVAGGIMSAIFGVLLGIPSLKVRNVYLAITTIGFNFIVNAVMNNWITLTGGPDGLPNIPPPSFGPLTFRTMVGKYAVIVTILLLFVWGFSRFKDSRVGRALQAIKDDELAASHSGINVHYYKVLAFTMSAFVTGVGGALYASFIEYISPDTFAFASSPVLLSMLLVGGIGSTWGPVIGAFLLEILSEGLRFLRDYYMAIYGLLVVIMALRMPQGLAGLFSMLGEKIRASMRQHRKAPAGKEV